MEKKQKKTMVSLAIDPDVKMKLQEHAKHMGQSVSSVIQELIVKHLAEWNWKH